MNLIEMCGKHFKEVVKDPNKRSHGQEQVVKIVDKLRAKRHKNDEEEES